MEQMFFILIGISLYATSANIIDVSWLISKNRESQENGHESFSFVEQTKKLSPVIFGQ